jgi:site-specific DNA-methyltransferase (adenine-specific)
MLFAHETLGELLWLKRELRLGSRVDRFLMAALLGIMHGKKTGEGHPTGLTVSMPNTFSMSPAYVARYIKTNGLRPPALSVIPFLRGRIEELSLPGEGFQRGQAWLHDAANPPKKRLRDQPAKLIFTSPPYLRVIKYGQYNWIRLWMLDQNPKPVDSRLFTTESVKRYRDFMSAVLDSLALALREDGYLCLVVGDVVQRGEELNLASALAKLARERTRLHPLGTVTDRLPTQHKVSRIWGSTKGKATRTDRVLILGGPKAEPLGPLEAIRWR